MASRFGSCNAVEEIGSGAISSVYRAVQEPLGRTVAVKALKPTIATSSPFAAQLEHEARVLGELGHPNVVELFDYVKTEDELYLVLEYLDGRSVRELLARRRSLSPEVVAAIGAEVARGLAHVHGKGLVHRDVKPANVLFSKSGDVKLVDFSIARRERVPAGDESAPADAAAFGTPAYMSPEQILGESVDARSDLFSLGVVLYQMLSGVRPFDGGADAATTALRIRRDPPKPLGTRAPEVPRRLERLVMRLLEKLPADRASSAAATADELDEVVRASGKGAGRALIVRALKEAGLTHVATPFGLTGEAVLAQPRPSLRGALAGLTAAFLALTAGGAAIQWGAREGSASGGPDETPFEPRAALRVVATPWADVWIDGRHVETTPFARAIPLRPGKHYVKLTHPAAPPELRTVSLAPGETGRLEVAMHTAPAEAVGSSTGDARVP